MPTFQNRFEQEKYNVWKQKHEKEVKQEKTKTIILYVAVLSFLVIAFFGLRFFIQGKHIFLGKETKIVNGIIEKVTWRHWGQGYFRQIAHYSYTFNGKTYHDKSKTGSLRYMKHNQTIHINDKVFIKISISEPETNQLLD